MLKYSSKKIIEVQDWDDLVVNTYGKPYNFQQQDGCQPRGTVEITIPSESHDDEMNDSIPEKVNGKEIGVKFDVWLARDPKQLVQDTDGGAEWKTKLFWKRNFYPDLQTVANDLYIKGLIDKGDYIININW